MKIVDIKVGYISIPLKKPFKTALRTVENVNDIIVEIKTDTGNIGYGEAPPTAVITGDTLESVKGAIEGIISKQLIGLEIENIEEIMIRLDTCMIKNSSAKAAVDIAVYDLYGQLYNAPLYQLLGGYRNEITTDITISVDEPEQMAMDSIESVNMGFDVLKIKVGIDSSKDIERIKAIRNAIGYNIKLRLDANQGWKAKEAVGVLRKMEDQGLNIEFVEQPVKAHDFEGLKYVTENSAIPVLADESVFSPMDALKIMQMRAADIINIKLMKTGGIHNALKICAMAETYGVECMIGCMLESKVNITAAAHLAAAKHVITKIDLDAPLILKEDPIEGGVLYQGNKIILRDDKGLGFKKINNVIF